MRCRCDLWPGLCLRRDRSRLRLNKRAGGGVAQNRNNGGPEEAHRLAQSLPLGRFRLTPADFLRRMTTEDRKTRRDGIKPNEAGQAQEDFQDWCLKPRGHPSACEYQRLIKTRHWHNAGNCARWASAHMRPARMRLRDRGVSRAGRSRRRRGPMGSFWNGPGVGSRSKGVTKERVTREAGPRHPRVSTC